MQVTVNAAMTVDGKIASILGNSKISSEEDLSRVHELRASVDGIVVGISTVLVDDPRLTVRLATKQVRRKHPARIIIDSTGKIPLDSRVLRTASKVKTIVAVTELAHTDTISKIEKMGAVVIVSGKKIVNLKKVLSTVKKMGIKKILVEGGGEINWSFFSQGLEKDQFISPPPSDRKSTR